MSSRLFTRRALLSASLGGGVAVLTGCSPFSIVNGLIPAQGYRVRSDLAYGAHPRQQLDVREVVYPDVSHVRIVGALAAPFRSIAPVLDEVAAFVGDPPPATAPVSGRYNVLSQTWSALR